MCLYTSQLQCQNLVWKLLMYNKVSGALHTINDRSLPGCKSHIKEFKNKVIITFHTDCEWYDYDNGDVVHVIGELSVYW